MQILARLNSACRYSILITLIPVMACSKETPPTPPPASPVPVIVKQPLHPEALIPLFQTLEPWGGSDLTDRQWDQYIAVARLVQELDTEVVAKAISKYVRRHDPDFDDRDRLTQLLLLMPVVFGLPQSDPSGRPPQPGGYIGRSLDGSNEHQWATCASWPVRWTDDRPHLTAGLAGYIGRPYHPEDVFRQLREAYEHRNLPQIIDAAEYRRLSDPCDVWIEEAVPPTATPAPDEAMRP